MQTKSVAQAVVLAAFALSSTPALASHSRHRTHPRVVVTSKKKEASSREGLARKSEVASHGSKPKRDSLASVGSAVSLRGREHPAEPRETPKIAAAVHERMVFRTDSSDPVRPRRARLDEKSDAAGDSFSKSDSKGKDLEPVNGLPRSTAADPRPDEHSEKQLLHRTQAANATKADHADRSTKGGQTKGGTKACVHDAVALTRGQEEESFSLTTCEDAIAPFAIEKLSVLVRPESAVKPSASFASLAKAKGSEISLGVKRVDPGLVHRLQRIVEHFRKDGKTSRVSLVSGYRPNSSGSYHATGQALDMRIEGVNNDDLVSFCKTLPDTGCGYYPNSSFVHLDVRQPNTGHVYWIDTSGPGETPHYVASWPPSAEAPPLKDAREADAEVVTKLDRELPSLPVDEHPAHAKDPAAATTEEREEPKDTFER